MIDSRVWKNYRRDKSAIVENLMLAVEVVSPSKQTSRYTEKASEYQHTGIAEYWIVDPIEQQVTVMVLDKRSYIKTVFTEDKAIASTVFSQLKLTAAEILQA